MQRLDHSQATTAWTQLGLVCCWYWWGFHVITSLSQCQAVREVGSDYTCSLDNSFTHDWVLTNCFELLNNKQLFNF